MGKTSLMRLQNNQMIEEEITFIGGRHAHESITTITDSIF